MSEDVTELKQRLEEAFRAATKLYQMRGFQRRIGFGRKPALVNVDLANAWTRPGNPFTCEDIDDQIIPGDFKAEGAGNRGIQRGAAASALPG